MNTELTIPRSHEYPIRSGIYRTAGIFIVCTGVLWTLINVSWVITYLMEPLSISQAWVVSFLLKLVGQPVHQTGLFINSPLMNLEVTPSCTGIYHFVVLIGGLLAWSTTRSERNRGIIAGIIALISINIIRLVSIYYCALYITDWVPFFHGVFWEGVMVLFVPIFWIYWVNRISK